MQLLDSLRGHFAPLHAPARIFSILIALHAPALSAVTAHALVRRGQVVISRFTSAVSLYRRFAPGLFAGFQDARLAVLLRPLMPADEATRRQHAIGHRFSHGFRFISQRWPTMRSSRANELRVAGLRR